VKNFLLFVSESTYAGCRSELQVSNCVEPGLEVEPHAKRPRVSEFKTAGVPEKEFWDMFGQCFQCGKVVFKESLRTGAHLCAWRSTFVEVIDLTQEDC
jgi:hypothetical protein